MTSVDKFHRYPDERTVDYILQDDSQEANDVDSSQESILQI